MKNNNKGFTGIEIAGIVAIGFLAVTVVLPIFGIKIPGLPGSSGQTSTQKQIQTTRMVPYVNPDTGETIKVLNKDGSTTVLMQQDASNQTLDEKVIPRAPLAERIFMWFARLGFLGLVLALLFPAAAVAIWMWVKGRWKKLATELSNLKEHHAEMESDARRIITGMDKAFATIAITLADSKLPGEINTATLADKIIDEMKWTLGDYYDDSTKALVKSVQKV